jgi:hypothetical protein
LFRLFLFLLLSTCWQQIIHFGDILHYFDELMW